MLAHTDARALNLLKERNFLFDYIKGYVTYLNPEYVTVENGGIGYQIFTPNPFLFQVNEMEEITVYTYHHVREDISALFGFLSRQDKDLFKKLLSVSGIGPKGALAVLASGDTAGLIRAVEEENEKFLVKFPGVGKKTARQMILDLKGKLNDLATDETFTLFTHEKHEQRTENEKAMQEAKEALKVLGYAEREINKVLPTLAGENLATDQYIKKALQKLLK